MSVKINVNLEFDVPLEDISRIQAYGGSAQDIGTYSRLVSTTADALMRQVKELPYDVSPNPTAADNDTPDLIYVVVVTTSGFKIPINGLQLTDTIDYLKT